LCEPETETESLAGAGAGVGVGVGVGQSGFGAAAAGFASAPSTPNMTDFAFVSGPAGWAGGGAQTDVDTESARSRP
jgi:hypothetical protein